VYRTRALLRTTHARLNEIDLLACGRSLSFAAAFLSEHDLEPTDIQAKSNPCDDGCDGCNVQVSL
jgi:hypothetical protein